MGYELRRQLRIALGPDITGLQRAVALEIADDANSKSRKSYANLDDLVCWTGAKDTSVVRNALKRLAAAGWEFRVPIGKGKDGRVLYAVPGTRMTFVVPAFQEVATATPEPEKGEQGLPQGGAGAPPSTPQGGAGAHSEGAGAPSEGAGAPPYSSDSSALKDKRTTSTQGGAPATPSGRSGYHDRERDYAWKQFGDLWLLYPRSVQKEKAKRAWCDALDRGADPEAVVAAAVAFAQSRVGEDENYTPYLATWLNAGSYDDKPVAPPVGKPKLHAVKGTGHSPFQLPADQSAYGNGF